ncbi:MAG: aminopeptidase, partial [Halobacteria archaeon]|nr:aminopeptidase [Halobacteria archaeon]
MDERVREHARILVDWSTEIEEGENVVVTASPEAHELVVALYEEIGKRGANPVTLYLSDEASRAHILNYDGEFQAPEHQKALFEETDAIIRIRSDPNLMEMSDVPGDVLAERSRAMEPVREEMLSKRWCLTQHPTKSYAQNAEMSLAEYKDFI